MAAVNVALTVSTVDEGAGLLGVSVVRCAPAAPRLMVQPNVPVMTEAPIATPVTVLPMRRHMSIFDTPKDSLRIESRHLANGLPVISGNGAEGLEASR